MKNKLWIVGLIVLLTLLAVSPVLAQDATPPTDNEVNAIARNMYCPVCENIPLDVCPTEACAQWRQQISDMLEDGSTEQEIYDFFALQYGDRVLAEPPREGFNWLIYIVPPVVIAIFVISFFIYMQKKQKPAVILASAEAEETVKKEGDDYQSRLEDELKKRL